MSVEPDPSPPLIGLAALTGAALIRPRALACGRAAKVGAAAPAFTLGRRPGPT